jgi:hypothetical protein
MSNPYRARGAAVFANSECDPKMIERIMAGRNHKLRSLHGPESGLTVKWTPRITAFSSAGGTI